MGKPNGLDFSLADWKEWCSAKQYPGYTASQLFHWIFSKQVTDPALFSNLSAPIRQQLAEEFSWELPSIDSHLAHKMEVKKFLLKTNDQQFLRWC